MTLDPEVVEKCVLLAGDGSSGGRVPVALDECAPPRPHSTFGHASDLTASDSSLRAPARELALLALAALLAVCLCKPVLVTCTHAMPIAARPGMCPRRPSTSRPPRRRGWWTWGRHRLATSMDTCRQRSPQCTTRRATSHRCSRASRSRTRRRTSQNRSRRGARPSGESVEGR